MSLHDGGQPDTNTNQYATHDGETLKLFCQTCQQPICRDCAVIDHRSHNYSFIKDIFAAEREKVLDIVQDLKANISVLESCVVKINAQESKLQENSVNVRHCIDSFINAQVEILKEKGEHLKNELQRSTLTQEQYFNDKKDSLFLSLGCLKSSVEFTEQALCGGKEVDVLRAKTQLSQQLKQQTTALARVKPNDAILSTLEINVPLNNETVQKVAKISTEDDGYKLSMCGGNFGHLDETYVDKTCNFVISKENFREYFRDCVAKICPLHLKNDPFHFSNRSDNSAPSMPKKCAQVRIKSPSSMHFDSSVIEEDEDGSFLYSFCPEEIGTYTIEVIINGRYIQGCPFAWIVKEFVTSRQYRKMDDEY